MKRLAQRPLLRALFFIRSLRDQSQRLGCGYDADSFVGFEIEKIVIAGDNQVGFGGERTSDDMWSRETRVVSGPGRTKWASS